MAEDFEEADFAGLDDLFPDDGILLH